MSRRVSPSTARVYGLQRVTRIWSVSRATVYRRRHRSDDAKKRPGPLGAMSDQDLVRAIRQLLTDRPFHGEGYRKLWARLRFAGIRASRRRRSWRGHCRPAPPPCGGRWSPCGGRWWQRSSSAPR
jgi:putative transposase